MILVSELTFWKFEKKYENIFGDAILKGQQHHKHISDFNLSVGCFGTDIIQKCTKWSQIGVHGLKI
jgi:hypothetical protein